MSREHYITSAMIPLYGMRTFHRQVDLFNPAEYQAPVWLVGAGTIGSWTALGLAKVGISEITVYDDDTIEAHNTANQLYSPHSLVNQVELKKALHLQALIYELTAEIIIGVDSRFPPQGEVLLPKSPLILISAVDSMKSRDEIFQWIRRNPSAVRLFIDARTGGEVSKVFALNPLSPLSLEEYAKSLHGDNSAEIENEELRAASDIPCTARSIVDVSMYIAARIVNYVRNHLKGRTLPFEVDYDMTNDVWLVNKKSF